MSAGMHLPEVVSPRNGSPPARNCWRRRRKRPGPETGSTPTGGGCRWCASTSRSTGLTARTWSPVSRFTGHARSRHASQTLRQGLAPK